MYVAPAVGSCVLWVFFLLYLILGNSDFREMFVLAVMDGVGFPYFSPCWLLIPSCFRIGPNSLPFFFILISLSAIIFIERASCHALMLFPWAARGGPLSGTEGSVVILGLG